MASSLQQGINAAKAGRMQEALEFLKDAIIEEPQNAEVWVWIAAIIDDMDKQAIFLEKALEIDPHNIPAQRGLAYIEQRKRDQTQSEDDHLSDYTHPISPFPSSGERRKVSSSATWSPQTVDELGEMAHSPEKKHKSAKQKASEIENGFKLTPVEIGLLGVVALVFCFIGLLAASALFDFELPLGFILGERSSLPSTPPHSGVFLYEDEMFFEINRIDGLPTRDLGFPTSAVPVPMVLLWQTQTDRDQIKLVYETGAYIPIRAQAGRDGVTILQPDQELQPGLYCFQQLNERSEGPEAFYWCFKVSFSSIFE
jgi:tetratricopeptide (TPR) repeat protein